MIDSWHARKIHLDSLCQPQTYFQDQTRDPVFAKARSQSSGLPEPLRVSKLAYE